MFLWWTKEPPSDAFLKVFKIWILYCNIILLKTVEPRKVSLHESQKHKNYESRLSYIQKKIDRLYDDFMFSMKTK